MRGALLDGFLFAVCVVIPCSAGWAIEDPASWRWTHGLGAGLFVVATLMIFVGVRILLTDPRGDATTTRADDEPAPSPSEPREPARPSPRARGRGEEPLAASFAEATLAGGPLDARLDDRPRSTASSEIIHVERSPGSARVVALLDMGNGPEDVHLLELDVRGEDLRPEVLAEAVAGVASGEPPSTTAGPVDRVGYASGWGLTLPCPPLRQ